MSQSLILLRYIHVPNRPTALCKLSMLVDNITGVIPNPLPVLSTEPVLHKLSVDREISTDVVRRTPSLNALQVCYFSVCAYILVDSVVCAKIKIAVFHWN